MPFGFDDRFTAKPETFDVRFQATATIAIPTIDIQITLTNLTVFRSQISDIIINNTTSETQSISTTKLVTNLLA